MTKRKNFILFLVPFILFFPSLFFNFSYFDDNVLILENLDFLTNLRNIFQVFKKEVFLSLQKSAAYYRPILTLSFMFDAQISGASPFFYHLTNVIYHAINSILVFIFLKKLKICERVAFFLSLLFSIHPIITQAVAWIPGRNDSSLGLFTLLSFIFYIDYLEKGQGKNYFLFILFFIMAILTKETAIILPFFYLLYLVLFDKEKSHNLLEIILGFWGAFFLWFILRQSAIKNIIYLPINEVFQALIKNSPAFFLYLGKVFFPFNLSVLPTLIDGTLNWGIISTLICLFLIVLSQKINWRLLIFGICWLILFLFPNFVRPKTQTAPNFLEHRFYLPFVGLLIFFASLSLVNQFLSLPLRKNFFLIFLLGISSIITFLHLFNFRDRLVFWQNAVKTSPSSPLAHRNFGAMLYFEGKINEAKKEYEKALQLNPNEPMTHNNIGVIYLDQNKLDEAEKEFKKELAVNHNYDKALFNLGLVYFKKKNFEKAKEYFEKTLLVNPHYQEAYQYLIILKK